jgi:hypothetical protein
MSGALVELVAKGVQDIYLTDSVNGEFLFKTVYTRHRNFAQAPKRFEILGGGVQNNGSSSVLIPSIGDLLTGLWIEGTALHDALIGTTFELYIGGQMIDRQTYEYMSEIWSVYLAETPAKADTLNNSSTQTNTHFFPLHFFFCDNNMFLPLVALQYHQVEIRISWGPNVVVDGVSQISTVNGNLIYLDTEDREAITKRTVDILITQVQKTSTSSVNLDLSVLNHPVKSIFFGRDIPLPYNQGNLWTFQSADILLNGTYLLENMSPVYFCSVQVYYNTTNGTTAYDYQSNSPKYTQYFMYNFCLNASDYKPTGSCNFSRLDNAKMNFTAPSVTIGTLPDITLYALNYNVLRIKNGLAGILFSN